MFPAGGMAGAAFDSMPASSSTVAGAVEPVCSKTGAAAQNEATEEKAPIHCMGALLAALRQAANGRQAGESVVR